MNEAEIALFNSYSLGMFWGREKACPTLNDRDSLENTLEVTEEETTLEVSNVGIESSQTIDEVCFWMVQPERDIWITEVSTMYFALEEVSEGQLYIFQGSNRSNVTESLIENGQAMAVGAPLELSINDDLVLVFKREDQVDGADPSASFKAKAWIEGRKYPWWEKPFIGEEKIYY